MDFPILSTVIWLPIVGGLVLLAMGQERTEQVRWAALVASTLITGFASGTADMQFVEHAVWIPALGASYALGVDGIAMPLIVLTTFLTPLVVISSWKVIQDRVAQYFASFLIMEGLMVGVFAATDALLFYVFWEAMLIPMFLIIGIWGGPRRVYATIKFFLYTFLGSVFMLVALIYMYMQTGGWAISGLYALPLGMEAQKLIFIAFLLAFAVKVPMFPVHTWLPDAHVEAPTGGSVILAAILLKLGGYGFLRFMLPITPDASAYFADFIVVLSLIAIVYIGLVALMQKDMKKLIAYSSIAHMGFATLGFFLVYAIRAETGGVEGALLGLQGSMIQMVSHGFISGAMFLCVGVMYDRVHSREIADYGGVVHTMPKFAGFMVLFAMANAGLPATSGFVGEFMVILASFNASVWVAAIAAVTLITGAAYTLWMVKRVIYGPVANQNVAAMGDLDRREFLVLALLAFGVLALGLWPGPLAGVMEATLENLIRLATASKL
jgi:NADH-quinone oxidoreductase subunit M